MIFPTFKSAFFNQPLNYIAKVTLSQTNSLTWATDRGRIEVVAAIPKGAAHESD